MLFISAFKTQRAFAELVNRLKESEVLNVPLQIASHRHEHQDPQIKFNEKCLAF